MAKNCKVPTCSYPVFSKMLCMNHWRQQFGKPIFKHETLKQTAKTPAKPFKIKPVSASRLEALKKYRRLRDKFLEGKTCEFPNCNSTKVTLHHKRGRCGAFLTDKRHFCALCLQHHQWVENNVLEAQKMNLSGKRLDK